MISYFIMNYARAFYTGTVWVCLYLLLVSAVKADAGSHTLADTIARIKPSIVGVGTVQQTRRPPKILLGTGFVVADGYHVLTNAHVIPDKLAEDKHEFLVVFVGHGKNSAIRRARPVTTDNEHDLCLLRVEGPRLPAMQLGEDSRVREGELYAFTGYPLGAILGLYASTHRGIISAITPIAIPVRHSRQLNRELIKRLQRRYPVFQLDATAYPGNSGSPLYDIKSGHVVGIINKVFVKGTKEHAITDPSGITYAIPVRYAHKLLHKAGF